MSRHARKHTPTVDENSRGAVVYSDPPPQELTWDSPIKDLFLNSYAFSDDLIDAAKPPRLIRMYADRWQVNWQLSGIPDPEAQTVMDVYFTVRPVAPATIEIKT